jgi:hypothetical protein
MKAPAATACMMQQIGFKAAAPCMIKYMKTFRTAADTQLAAQTVALEDQVRAGRISNRDAYTRYVAIRNEINRRLSAPISARRWARSQQGSRRACRAQPPATASARPCSVRLGNPRQSAAPLCSLCPAGRTGWRQIAKICAGPLLQHSLRELTPPSDACWMYLHPERT